MQPEIFVFPETSVYDERVVITIDGLPPRKEATIRLSFTWDKAVWSSFATFSADEECNIDLTKTAPRSGTYQGIDSMGLFCSAELIGVPELSSAQQTGTRETPPAVEMRLVAEVAGEIVASRTLSRRVTRTNVEQRVVTEQGLAGILFIPPGDDPRPALIFLGGSGGGVPEGFALPFADEGYVTLALGYFGAEGLPSTL